MLRAAWITTAIALLILVTVFLAEFFQQPLLDSPIVRDMLGKTGLRETSPTAPLRDLDQVQLLSRDLRSHPTQPDTLSLSLTIVNRAPRSQAFPRLEVILLDSSGQPLTSRLFEPGEYLAEDANIESGMTPGSLPSYQARPGRSRAPGCRLRAAFPIRRIILRRLSKK